MATLINQRLLKVCIEKYNFPTGERRQKIDGIIKGWQTAFKDHDLSKAKETSLQGKFFSKFFCEILGYTMQDDGNEVWTLKQEAKTEVDGKEADGSLGFYSKSSEKTHCVIELKDAQCNLDAKQISRESKQTPVEQAFQYLYKFADCDWVIVSNFRYTRLYHKSKGQTAYEEFDILTLHEEKEFKRFYYCLCCENLLDKSSKSPMDLLIKQSGETDIDITKEFYSEFKHVRKILFEHICENNPNYDKKLLLEKTQKLLDRFIFIFFCEDTAGLLPHNTVENIYKMAQNSFSMSPCRIWEQFRGLFVAIDKGNNNVTNINDLLSKQYIEYEINQRDYLQNTSYTFNIYIDSEKQKVNEKIRQHTIFLGEICDFISPGIDGNKEKYVCNFIKDNNYNRRP